MNNNPQTSEQKQGAVDFNEHTSPVALVRPHVQQLIEYLRAEAVDKHRHDIRLSITAVFGMKLSELSFEHRAWLADEIAEQLGSDMRASHDLVLRILGIPRTEYLRWLSEIQQAEEALQIRGKPIPPTTSTVTMQSVARRR